MCQTEYRHYGTCNHPCRKVILRPSCTLHCRELGLLCPAIKLVGGKRLRYTERVDPALRDLGIHGRLNLTMAKKLKKDLLKRWDNCSWDFPEPYLD